MKFFLNWVALICLAVFWLTGCRTAPQYGPLDRVANGGRAWFTAMEKAAGKLAANGQLVRPDVIQADQPKRADLQAPKPVGRYRSGPDLYRYARRATVIVGPVRKCKNPTCSIGEHVSPASGVIIDPSGIVATAYHVIKSKNHLGFVVGTADGTVYPVVKILAADEDSDVVLLKIKGGPFPYLPPAGDAPPGTEVYCLSHPRRQMYQMTRGIVTGYHLGRQHNADSKTVTQRRRMNISADFAKGSSGGPVLDAYGRVVGLVSSTSPIYYIEKRDKHDLIQMVIKQCAPGSAIVDLFEEPVSETSKTGKSGEGQDCPTE